MNFLLADTFADSLTRLTTQEQKAVKTSVFDLQMDPSHPGLQMHRLENAKDPDFWSARVSRDIRLIIHRSGQSLLVCYVGHHDAAYAWAEKRKLTTHPKTGALQIVEIRELVQEIPVYVQAELPSRPKPPLFAQKSDEELLGYGVPPEWLDMTGLGLLLQAIQSCNAYAGQASLHAYVANAYLYVGL
jgi:mRNA-degrading endonuclease RelE of RelBE toxin-antitoxin system